jgi:hypothetical protein
VAAIDRLVEDSVGPEFVLTSGGHRNNAESERAVNWEFLRLVVCPVIRGWFPASSRQRAEFVLTPNGQGGAHAVVVRA